MIHKKIDRSSQFFDGGSRGRRIKRFPSAEVRRKENFKIEAVDQEETASKNGPKRVGNFIGISKSFKDKPERGRKAKGNISQKLNSHDDPPEAMKKVCKLRECSRQNSRGRTCEKLSQGAKVKKNRIDFTQCGNDLVEASVRICKRTYQRSGNN